MSRNAARRERIDIFSRFVARVPGRAGRAPMRVLRPIAMFALPFAFAAIAHAGNEDAIFADGFESPLVFNAYVTSASITCASGSTITPHQGETTRLCYRFINATDDITFTHQHVEDSALGVTYDHDFELAPGAFVAVDADVAPFPIEANDYHLATWTASAPARTAVASELTYFAYDPYVHLHALIVDAAADCLQGVDNDSPFLSGLTAVTVAPGAVLFGCYRAQNDGGTRLNRNRFVDDELGTLLDGDATELDQGGVYSLPRSLDTAATRTMSGTWHAGFGSDDVTRSSAQARVTVVADPACHGIATSSTIGYGAIFANRAQANLTPSGMRLDMDVSATPVRANADFSIEAHGRMPSVASLFGPRNDTRIVVPVPAGVDLAHPVSVHATLNGNVPLTPVVDVAARTITLHTGPIAGPPGSIDLTIMAHADAGTDPLRFIAPTLELDFLYQGFPISFGAAPDPDAPPVLTAPRCAS